MRSNGSTGARRSKVARRSPAAIQAYERAIAADPALVKARLNLGGLLHEAGRHMEAERVYRAAIEADGSDAVLYYNLGVLLEDMGRKSDAMDSLPGGAASRSRSRRLPLQSGVAVRGVRQAEGRNPAHGAVSQAHGEGMTLMVALA